jgi:hypothetical protein
MILKLSEIRELIRRIVRLERTLTVFRQVDLEIYSGDGIRLAVQVQMTLD